MANAFQDYEYLPKKQKELMKIELKKIETMDGISEGLFEIISKTLKAGE